MVYQADRLDHAFGALADRTRRAIVAQLARGERSISEIARSFDITLPAVSKHVRVLERAGLAVVRQEGRTRHCRLAPGPLREAAGWISQYRGFWEASFDRLDAYLDEPLTVTDSTCLTPRQRPTQASSSKFAASSKPRASGSSPRGPRPKR